MIDALINTPSSYTSPARYTMVAAQLGLSTRLARLQPSIASIFCCRCRAKPMTGRCWSEINDLAGGLEIHLGVALCSVT